MWGNFDLQSVKTRHDSSAGVKVLCVSSSGNPLRWIGWRRAAIYSASDMIEWSIANEVIEIRGTKCNYLLPTVLAVKGSAKCRFYRRNSPPITNQNLFRRDMSMCLYCGKTLPHSKLTRDHVKPQSLGGKNVWSNIATACGPCNLKKGCAPTPEAASMSLLAIPYQPSFSEYLILSNRQILFDQMEFLKKGVNKNSNLRLAEI